MGWSIRHSLKAFLERLGGAYWLCGRSGIPPAGRCYYDPLLAIQIAGEKLGIGRILVTCDDDNIGSIRTIEKNGGILENVVNERDCDKQKRRYWVEAQ